MGCRRPKTVKALFIVGAILVFIGMGFTYAAITPWSGSETIQIPAGEGWYYYVEIQVLGGGSLEAEWEELAGREIGVWVLNRDGYTIYSQFGNVGTTGVLLHNQSAAGSLNLGLPGTGSFFLIFDHGGNWSAPHGLWYAVRVAGVDPEALGEGMAMVAIGVVLMLLPQRKLHPEPRAAPLPPRPANVIIFDEWGNPPVR